MELEVEIERLGAQGDGVAEGPDGPIFVPFTLPGERVLVAIESEGKRADLLEVLNPSPSRVAPICRHFGSCGGCALQHMEEGAYLAWKREQVVAALRARGLEPEVEAVRPVSLGTRRRASLALGRTGGTPALGYRRARSHDLVDIASCPVLSPRIEASLPKLKAVLEPLIGRKREARVSVTETAGGLDVLVEGVRPGPATLSALAASAESLGAVRIAVGEDGVTLSGAPMVSFSGVDVKLPAGAFLQASKEAEAVLVSLVKEGVGRAKRVADLFAGLGTFTLALARQAAVDAYEADESALRALAEAARRMPGLKPIRTHPSDLFRSPLGSRQFDGYDAVVLDPPRAGAAAQSEELAKSRVKRLVAVSCSPGTLARDLRILVDGGYRIARVVPVDQFLYSPHVEVVASLTR
jgi:23S rRNA (uracil1939-C5)-methyltransferase